MTDTVFKDVLLCTVVTILLPRFVNAAMFESPVTTKPHVFSYFSILFWNYATVTVVPVKQYHVSVTAPLTISGFDNFL